MGQLTVLCRQCFGYSKHDEWLAGQSVRCPKCDAILDVPVPVASAAEVEALKSRPMQEQPILATVVKAKRAWSTAERLVASIGGGGLLLLILCCGSVFWVASRPPSMPVAPGRNAEPDPPREILPAGSKAYVWDAGQPMVLIPVDEQASEELYRMSRAGNRQGVSQLVGDGRAFFVVSDTPVTIVDAGFLSHRIRVLDGIARGHEGVLAVESVHSRKSR